MKNRVRRTGLLLAAVVAVLLAVTGASGWRMRSAGVRMEEARSNLRGCERLAAEVLRLRQRPSVATMEVHSATELASQVEDAMRSSQVPDGALMRIEPAPPRRLENSDYKVQPTDIEIQGVSLRQLTGFLQTLVAEPAQMLPTNLRLTAPRYKDARTGGLEKWSVELTLTHLIYLPKTLPP